MRLALTHLSTMPSYNPACDAMESKVLFPSSLVNKTLFWLV